ncbi:glycosyltransferase [Microvirga sp. CF3016]|uniref:glycosyltransferase n=1 Tax=Microvirga sp. CF3016 TaxID=3110181 RepID=UPI002E79B613|nr:glycosyltransferase [Microvirga sp. CF3016]MEE1610157.1 glycosyltransferase [Microvirga sp. CF3016]
MARYPEAPKDLDEAYRFYRETGMKQGQHPGPSFENLRYPGHAHVPQGHLFRVTASPILCRVPPTQYLAPYQIKSRLHKLYNTFDDYLRRTMIMPDTIGPELWESDLRVVAYMDNTKRKLAADYSTAPQDTLISIVMPTRNRAAVLGDAIVSVLMQSYENWELIVVDDASDDAETEGVVRQFSDSRIRFIRLDEPVGVAIARNTGIEHAAGQVIAYLDDDDQWDPDCLLILLNQMRSQGARLSYGAEVMWDKFEPNARLGHAFKGIRFAPFNRSLLENRNYIAPITLLHERDLLREVGWFDPSLKRYVGWDLILRMTEVATPLAVPCLLGHSFRVKADSVVTVAEDTALRAVRAKLMERSEWSQPFATTDEQEHLAFSISREARRQRQKRLASLPAELVQIVIPNYESPGELEMCLRSIAEHTPTPYHVLIVDNGSSEETYAQLEKLPRLFENVRLIREDEKSGFSFAVNRGLAEVMDRDEKIMILNNDTLATPDWLDELRYVFFKHDDAGMVVPRQVLPANNKITKVHMPGAARDFECDINLSLHHSNILDLAFDHEDGLVELTYAPLFCGLVRPEAIRAAGGLDSGNAPHYRSDWILCDFIRRHLQQRIVYTPHSKVYHLQGVATEKRKSTETGFLGRDRARTPVSDSKDHIQA